MASEPKQIIPMPELDSADGAARLVLTTRKVSRGLASCAHVEYVGEHFVRFEMFGDFRVYPGSSLKAPATQKNLDALHAANFPPESIDGLLGQARAFYANKRGR